MPKDSDLNLASPKGANPDFSMGSIFFIGTATVILRCAGFTILHEDHFDQVVAARLIEICP